jgi:hypothetical protein
MPRAKTARRGRTVTADHPDQQQSPATDARERLLSSVSDVRVRRWLERLLCVGSDLPAPDEEQARAASKPP